ncbi:MAG: transglutaminase domain-containing protein, partial [Acidobacteriota bacterium]
MTRNMGILFAALLLAFVCGPVQAQTQSLEDQWRTLNAELARKYGQRDWPGAMRVIEEQLKLAERTGDREARAGVLYNKACVHALSGEKEKTLAAIREAVTAGFTDYFKYLNDPDFNSLSADPDFKTFLAELKEKYGPRPLVWDRSQPVPQFKHLFDGPQARELLELRREFTIDVVLDGARDDYERLRRLTHWVSTRWQHSPNQMASKSDPLTILREAQKGGRFICREYAIVLAGLAAAYGVPARLLNLLPRDVETRSEAHSVAEVWLEQFHKWVLADGQYGAIGELDGIPLNGLELQAAFAADLPVVCSAGASACADWKPFILRNAFYFKTADDQRSFRRSMTSQLVLVPKGAPNPTKFAGGNEEVFAGAIYTSNPDVFYAPPQPLPRTGHVRTPDGIGPRIRLFGINGKQLYVLGTLHGEHARNSSFSWPHLERILSLISPGLLLVEIRPEHLKAEEFYSDGPLEMAYLIYLASAKKIDCLGIDWWPDEWLFNFSKLTQREFDKREDQMLGLVFQALERTKAEVILLATGTGHVQGFVDRLHKKGYQEFDPPDWDLSVAEYPDLPGEV